MTSWRKTLVGPSSSMADAIRAIDISALQICLVVDDGMRLLGTVTDGDIRRAILRAVPLDAPVTGIMFKDPTVARPDMAEATLLSLMQGRKLRQLPLVDGERRLLGLITLDELLAEKPERKNWVVLMAGGLGTRLRPLTENLPKPMLKVGNKPILEHILETLVAQGFRHFRISVNYRAEAIVEHFGDGAAWGAEIRYIEEKQRMGTAGPLGLLPGVPEQPVLVMNGDLLTRVNFANLIEYHEESGAIATMCVREYDFQVPFGVVKIAGNRIEEIEEKPVHRFLVNAGIYVLSPPALDVLPKEQSFDMPDLFRALMARRNECNVFPIREYWLDIGRMDQFEQANRDYAVQEEP